MSVLNLPRFLQETIILVGIIPGPKEPQLHINTLLRPLVDDLMLLWQGLPMELSNGMQVFVRATLICVGCDIPAARKACGFVGHRALKGCSKCLHSFPTAAFGEKGDYSNFNRSSWESRSNYLHRDVAGKYQQSNTRAEQYAIERAYGIRYSVLLELPYFDAARMCVIDPMHNLLLGTAKHMVELWKVLGVLSPKQYDDIQARVDSYVCPSDMGRVPSKISSSFSGFTAEQWKNWTMYFSLFYLKNVLPREHYSSWQLFVNACYLLCCRIVTRDQVKKADDLLNEFCTAFLKLYGPRHCNMNMHLHLHLAKCIYDFGPVYSFWCFSFERMNGVLGSYHTNNLFSSQVVSLIAVFSPSNWPKEFCQEYYPVIVYIIRKDKSSLMQKTVDTEFMKNLGSLQIAGLPPIKELSFSQSEIDDLNGCSFCTF